MPTPRLALLTALALTGLCCPLGLTLEDDQKIEYPFQIVVLDGKPHKFDKRTGKLEPLAGNASPTKETSIRESAPPQPLPEAPAGPTELSAPKAKDLPPVILPDDDLTVEKDAPDGLPARLTDSLRHKALNDISGYRANLGIIQSVKVAGDQITGTIALTNKGNKRLRALEIALVVPTNEKKAETHYFLLNQQQGKDAPPQPAAQDGAKADPVFIRIELPAPAGIKGKLDTRVSYLKFE